ncbi:MAG: site-2 protease family protein [Candidatus Riflebacteria bacterium]|nr:site-2 protease family protein [Candidatus Riflebacteria bacterium]
MPRVNRSIIILVALFVVYGFLGQVNQAGGLDPALRALRFTLLFVVPSFLIGIVLHEFAHAAVATWRGDPTPKALGRLTLNPLKHLDPLGTAMIFLAGFVWANPVPISPQYFRNPKRDLALAAGAGPAMNVTITVLSIVAINAFVPAYERDPLALARGSALFTFLLTLAQINALLAVFNLIPIPPLDGSHFMRVILSPRAYFTYHQNQLLLSAFGFVLLLAGFFDPLFKAVQMKVAELCLTQYWGVN